MEMEQEVEAVTIQWQKIEAYLQTHAPGGSQAHLNSGATEQDIVQAETALRGIRFPNDFRASLKRHNGQASGETLLGMGPLLSTEGIITEWNVWTELLDGGSVLDWNPRWIPITTSGSGDNDCLVMDPAQGDAVGQVVQMCHEDGGRPMHAPSFLAWLTPCASKLQDGSLVWDEDSGFVAKEETVVL